MTVITRPMPRGKRDGTQAWDVLKKNVNRTRSFTRIFFAGSTKPARGDKRGRGKPSNEENELLRAAIVFSIGALDAYLSEVTAEVLIAQIEYASSAPTSDARAILRRVVREDNTLALELALTIDPAKRRTVARQAILDHLTSSVSNHGSKAVANTLSRIGGTGPDKLWGSLNSMLEKWPDLATSGRTAAAILDHWTDQRHRLVHEGRAVPVTGKQIEQLINFIEALGTEVDKEAVGNLPKGVRGADDAYISGQRASSKREADRGESASS